MKKLLAILIALTLMLSCLSVTAMAESYKTKLLNTNITLPKQMALVNEEKLADGSGVELTFTVKGQDDAAIYTDIKKIKEYKGYTMGTLPEEERDSWTEYYYEYYPVNASAGLLPSKDGKGDSLYCYCGQGEDGGSLLVYASLKDGVYVCSYCISEAEGISKVTMQATLEALNAANAAVFKTSSAGKAAVGTTAGRSPAPVFRHDDYDTLILFLLLEEDDEAPDLYDDETFDFEYVEMFEEENWDDEESGWGDLDDAGFDWDLDGSDWSDDVSGFGDWSDDAGGFDDWGNDAGGYDAGGFEDYGGYDDYGGDWGGDDW